MANNVNTAFQTTALLAIGLIPGILWAAEVSAVAVPNDPFIDAVYECHGKYAEEYTSIANTASSIADRATTRCKKEMDAYERNAVSPTLVKTLDLNGVEDQRAKLVSLLKDGLRTFTMEMAVLYGATSD